jgi:hypothetical protein
VKEDQLIKRLVQDLRPVGPGPRIDRGLGLFLLWSGLSVLVFTRAGTTLSGASGLLAVFALIIPACAAAAGAMLSAIPGVSSWRYLGLVAAVALAAWAGELGHQAALVWNEPATAWGEIPWAKCFAFTLLAAIPPGWALIRTGKGGWPVHPRITSALAFTAGACSGALAITLECRSGAPLHALFGHWLPIAASAVTGAWMASRVFPNAPFRSGAIQSR